MYITLKHHHIHYLSYAQNTSQGEGTQMCGQNPFHTTLTTLTTLASLATLTSLATHTSLASLGRRATLARWQQQQHQRGKNLQ